MSLINDALKRASQTEKNRPRESGPPPANMQAVSEPRRSNAPVIIIVCVVVLLAVAGFLVWHSFSGAETSAQAPAPAPVAPRAVVPAPAPKVEQVAPAPVPTPAPQPVVVTPPPDTNPPTPPPQPVAVVPPPQPAPTFPDLKLQGILYNARNPRATINGTVKREGEQIDGVTIVKINQNSVTVSLNGQTKDLFLNGQ